MATYNELVTMVRDWANRDSAVLPDSVIQSSLRYAADEAYRALEIPPLEYTRYYVARGEIPLTYCVYTSPGVYTTVTSSSTKDATTSSNTTNVEVENAIFSVPHDTVSFIYLRTPGNIVRPEIGATVSGTTITEDNQNNYAVMKSNDVPSVISHGVYVDTMYNEKVDVRTFFDFNDSATLQNYFTRKGSQIILAGDIKEGLVFELFYYRRLPALDARPTLPDGLTLAAAQADTTNYEVITSNTWDTLTSLEKATYDLIEGSYVRSAFEVANWLKDHNERVVLFGALHRVFDYLQEDQQSEKYKARFVESIQELNAEEKKRKLSAGQAYIRFDANNLI